MGIFDRFHRFHAGRISSPREGSKPPSEVSEASKAPDLRMQERYAVARPGISLLKLDGHEGTVTDISYGGLLVKFPVTENTGSSNDAHLDGPLKGRLLILDRTVEVLLKPVRTIYQEGRLAVAGLQFLHESPETLLFLREFIEPLRCGGSLVRLDESIVKGPLKDPSWLCLRGDGPTDLKLKFSADVTEADKSELVEAHLIFRRAETYCELLYQEGRLQSARSARTTEHDGEDPFGLTSLMTPTANVDPEILRHGLAILLGLPLETRSKAMPIFEMAGRLIGI